jgi:hypothetical protein
VRKLAWLILPLLWLAAPSIALSEVDIPEACRIANLPPGRCGWCSVETLARHLGIKTLYGMTDKNPSNSRPRELEAALTAHKVKYRIQGRGNTSTGILQDAIREDLGAVVGFRPLCKGEGGHIVTLVDFGKEQVRILDPNDKDQKVRTMDMDTFLERWDGFALVLERP